jgi:hypothetical protein
MCGTNSAASAKIYMEIAKPFEKCQVENEIGFKICLKLTISQLLGLSNCLPKKFWE